MVKHIEVSCCWFELFKVLAKNYLNVDSHKLHEKINSCWRKLNDCRIYVENLMLKFNDKDEETYLKMLIKFLRIKIRKKK